MTYIRSDKKIWKYAGTIWYVNGTGGNDSNSGTDPDEALATIGQAVTNASAGDAIVTYASTYAEAVDLNKNALEFHPEIGTIIAPASGTPLTISANYCKVQCPGGSLRINPGANETGVLITGVWAYVSDVRVFGNSSADIGFHVGSAADNTNGDGSVLTNCRCSSPLIAAFKIQANKVKLEDCCTGGESGDSSIGFWITPDASGVTDKVRLKDCGSQGHESGGFVVDAGCTNGGIESCYSGGGDGKSTDADNAFVWSNFHYDRIKYKSITFTATGGVGGAGTNYNLFKVTGTVRVSNIFGHVTTVLPATSTVPNLELYSSNASVDITYAAGGPDISGAVVDAVLKRLEPAGEPLLFSNPDSTPAITESSNYRDPHVPAILTKDDAADTYIQLQLSAALASGAMHWHVEWEAVTDDGFLEPA